MQCTVLVTVHACKELEAIPFSSTQLSTYCGDRGYIDTNKYTVALEKYIKLGSHVNQYATRVNVILGCVNKGILSIKTEQIVPLSQRWLVLPSSIGLGFSCHIP